MTVILLDIVEAATPIPASALIIIIYHKKTFPDRVYPNMIPMFAATYTDNLTLAYIE